MRCEDVEPWLIEINNEFRRNGVPHARRPFDALHKLATARGVVVAFDHPIARIIFRWFQDNGPPGAHQVGSIYRGVFFYDAAFWAISVPLVFGSVSVKAMDCLPTMSKHMLHTLARDQEAMPVFGFHWLNCMHYGFGSFGMKSAGSLSEPARQLFWAGHAELVGANSQLLQDKPNLKAILGFRMTVEIMLKVVIVQEVEACEKELKDIGHSLKRAARKCFSITGDAVYDDISADCEIFPLVGARYRLEAWSESVVWRAALLSQYCAASVARRYCGVSC